MEELLNKLREKGWRIENPNARISDVKYMYGLRELRIVYETELRDVVRQYPIRFLVSKESGLWQFCCRNKLVDGKPEWIKTCGGVVREEKSPHNSHYRIIESALCDEDELEKFLLENIKIN